MSKLQIQGNASGSGIITIVAPNTDTNRTITIPDSGGELVTSANGRFLTAEGVIHVANSASSNTVVISSSSDVSITGNTDVTGTLTTGVGVGSTYTANVSSNTAPDMGTYQNFVITLTGSITLLNPSTQNVGQSGFIVFKQDGTGSRTVALSGNFKTAGGSGLSLTSTASSTDFVPYIISQANTILLGTPQLAFS